MKIFITGITGLLGRHIAELCFKDGHEIFALVRDKNINKSLFSFDFHTCFGDLANIQSIPEFLCNSDIVVNCAADTNMGSLKNKWQEEVNINGLNNLIIASKRAGIKRFIHISSANTFLYGCKELPADESVKLKVKNSRLPYINSKILGEEILLNEFRQNNFPVIILNPTLLLGPNNFNLSSSKLIYFALKKRILFYPCGGRNIVDVRDVAQAVMNCFHLGILGQNYLLSNENLTYRDLFLLTCGYANRRKPMVKIPYFLGLPIGFFGTIIESISKKPKTINHKTTKLLYQNHYYNSDRAKNEIGFKCRLATETIQDTVIWFKNEYVPN